MALLPVLAAAVPGFRRLPFGSVRILYVLPPSRRVWRRRLAGRGLDAAAEARRLAEAERSLEFAVTDDTALFVVNDDLATATDDLITVVLRRPWPEHLQRDQARARDIAGEMMAAPVRA